MPLSRRLCLLVALLLPIPFGARCAFASEAQWVEIQSPHFSVITDGGEKRGRETAMRFEQMRSVYATLMAKATVNLPIPLQIVAFRNTKEMRQVAPLWQGKPVQLAGLFQSGTDRCFIMLDLSVDNPWSVVSHEYAHQLMNGNLSAQVDPWFQEGFAEYFSSIEVDGKQARVGKIPPQTYEILRQSGMMRLADLLKVRQNSSTYNESGDHRTVFYAESSMLMHYVIDNNLIAKVATYFDLRFNKNVTVEDAVQQAFGMSAAQLDKALRSYLMVGQYRYYFMPAPADIIKANYNAKPLSPQDADAVIADVHLHSRDYQDKAISEFQTVLAAEPNNAAACRGLGYAYMQKKDFAQAREYFKRAAAANSQDPRVHYYIGLLLNVEGTFGDASAAQEMADEMQTAIRLDPNFADAYALLAFAQVRTGDPGKAVATAHKAVDLSPGNPTYWFDLAEMYAGNRQPDQAITIFQVLEKSSDEIVAQRATIALAQAEHFKDALRANSVSSVPLAVRTSSPPETAPTTDSGDSANGQAAVLPESTPIKFLKGSILSVDCSSAPAAVLTVSSGAKIWTMQVQDSKHVLVLGGNGFSCTWKNQKVALNYREAGESGGNVVSIEIQ